MFLFVYEVKRKKYHYDVSSNLFYECKRYLGCKSVFFHKWHFGQTEEVGTCLGLSFSLASDLLVSMVTAKVEKRQKGRIHFQGQFHYFYVVVNIDSIEAFCETS